ncbi:MarR family winged helix-turn-helix transcriptional regulator [Pseudonocardia nematodicida]|uniref:MarR family winged helix-turn-helix transcriptional regulator n=1 Tax=Pseudonocardia nematodicida TaxID=1206997 RepID=UPI003607AF32
MELERGANLVGAFAEVVSASVQRCASDRLGMSGEAAGALSAIVAEPAMSIETLRRSLSLTHPGTVRLVDRLVERNWVERRRTSGRAVMLFPTPQGAAMVGSMQKDRDVAITRILASLSEEQQATLAELLGVVLAASVTNSEELRRLCRLCNRRNCEPCPPWEQIRSTGDPVTGVA